MTSHTFNIPMIFNIMVMFNTTVIFSAASSANDDRQRASQPSARLADLGQQTLDHRFGLAAITGAE